MRVHIYIDESGSIHKNSRANYFVLGGFMIDLPDDVKMKKAYRKKNLACRKRRYRLEQRGKLEKREPCILSKQVELKASQMFVQEKEEFFSIIADLVSFYGCVKVFDKRKMNKEISNENLFFNYAVQVFLHDCILPKLDLQQHTIIVSLFVDTRSIRSNAIKDLQQYLNTYYCFVQSNVKFSVAYCDSRVNYGIQFADLIVNTFYLLHKEPQKVDPIIKRLQIYPFYISYFPFESLQYHHIRPETVV